MSQFAIGIDLGTTHCVLSYLPLDAEPDTKPHTLKIEQFTAPGQVEAKSALPSFIYQASDAELSAEQRQLPWGKSEYIAGQLARDLGAKTPARLISSAKSWLGHNQVDRRSPLLPLQAADDVQKLSPLQASIAYLQQMIQAWDHQHPEAPIAEQNVTITVPASFDPGARELTAEAAKAAGVGHATLLEEPQAAMYAWIAQNDANWREQVSVGDTILVVDVGGGTTDLSLIAVSEQDGDLSLERIAVGEHLLLGGDNMDLALANLLRQKLAQQGTSLQPWQFLALSHNCRFAKEQLFNTPEMDTAAVVIAGRGTSLIGGSIRTELTRAEIEQVLLEGFFPHTEVNAPLHQAQRSALTTLSLPYAQDAAVTRHLGAFLTRQQQDEGFIQPNAILFNGGVMKAQALVGRTEAVVNQWLMDAGAEHVRILQGNDPDQAVAKGAAYYSRVQTGQGVRIRGGTAHSYYVGIESAMPTVPGMPPMLEAYCIAPFGMEEGTEAALAPHQFGLVVGEPVQFSFFASTTRQDDQIGTLLDFWGEEELQELPPIHIDLDPEAFTAGEVVPVQLQTCVSELGALELYAVPVAGGEPWLVEFDTRSTADELAHQEPHADPTVG